MKLFIVAVFILTSSKCFAGNAAVAALGAGAGAGEMAVATGASGDSLMHQTCGTGWGTALCAMGAALVVTAIANALSSGSNNDAGKALTANANNPNGGGAAGDPNPNNPAYNAIQPYVADAQQSAAKQGSSLQDLAANAPTGAGGGGSGSGDLPGIPDDIKKAMDEAAKQAVSKFRVSSVATEGGGGGGGRGSSGGTDPNIDLNSFLDKLNPHKPASVAGQGLQKSFNGEPIGVANDNIFAKITRAYQVKIGAQTFLPPTPATSGKPN